MHADAETEVTAGCCRSVHFPQRYGEEHHPCHLSAALGFIFFQLCLNTERYFRLSSFISTLATHR